MLVAVTGYGQEHDNRRALETVFSGHYVKQVDAKSRLGAGLSKAERAGASARSLLAEGRGQPGARERASLAFSGDACDLHAAFHGQTRTGERETVTA